MEELFKSLSESVSEECFEDIINMVESILSEEDSLDDGSHIRRKYGKPEYKKDKNGEFVYDKKGFVTPVNKSAELYAKAHSKDSRDPVFLHEPAYNKEGKGFGEYGKRVPAGDSDRGAWVTGETSKEIQEPLSVAKSQEKGARKLIQQGNPKGKGLLKTALIDKSSLLRKKADKLKKDAEGNYGSNGEDGYEVNTELENQAKKRLEGAQKASSEFRKLDNKKETKVPKK